MAKIISFISRKGGTGKTTNAIQIATMLHSLGYKLALIETDTNYTLSTLRKMELFKSGAKDSGVFEIIGSEDGKVLGDIEALHPQKMDFIIVDSAGKTTDENIKNLAIQSDAVIVPTSLTQNDILVTYQTVQDLKPAQDISKKLKIIVLPNRIHSRTNPVTIHKQLSDLKTVITENFVPAKNVYAQFSTILPEKQYQDITRELIGIIQS